MTAIIRFAAPEDLPELHAVIERAYRGDAARGGWTHEADLIREGDRTDLATLQSILENPHSRLLVATENGAILGCVHVLLKDPEAGLAYLGLLTVDPALQAAGLGKQLLKAAESVARDDLLAEHMEMTVIDVRAELIAWYERRGYARTGEKRPFILPLDPRLTFAVLVKPLG